MRSHYVPMLLGLLTPHYVRRRGYNTYLSHIVTILWDVLSLVMRV